MDIIIQTTEDGSDTCFNEQFGQAYHSKFGAYREALEKHVQACRIPELAQTQSELKILDICFGLGYNSFVAIEEALKINPEIKIEIIGLESDIEILRKISECKMPDSLKKFQELFKTVMGDRCKGEVGHCLKISLQPHSSSPITLHLGDARETILNLEDNSFDAVFFDPFSPSVCPELWTKEFISDVVSKTKPGAYLSTYSCARVVKDNFKAAGCEISEGPRCGRKNGGVLARRQ